MDKTNATPPKRKRKISGAAAASHKNNSEVEKKIAALQKIVPGGQELPVEDLFEETAEYIASLERQVKALRFLVAILDNGCQPQNTKSGA